MIKIVLEDCRKHNNEQSAFRVVQMQNTIEFRIGEFVSTDVVQDLCNLSSYQIVIQPRKEPRS